MVAVCYASYFFVFVCTHCTSNFLCILYRLLPTCKGDFCMLWCVFWCNLETIVCDLNYMKPQLVPL